MKEKTLFARVYCLLFFFLAMCTLAGCKLSKESMIFVTIAGNDAVVVIDENKAEAVAQIPVGAGPAIIIATPDNRKAYAANWGDDTISAIDTSSYDVTSIQLDSRPFIIAMAPDGKFVYAGLYANQIDVIDTATDTVVRSFATDILPASLFVSPDGEVLYVATTATQPGLIWAISTETGEAVLPPIEIGMAPGWITMTPDGAKIYALNYYSDDVSVVDTRSWTVEETIFTGEGSSGVIGNVAPDGSGLYITNLGTADVIRIDTASNEIVQTIPFGGRPAGVHFNADGSRLYVSDYGPASLENPPNSHFLYTGEWLPTDPGNVNILDSDTGETLSTIVVGPGPTSVVGITRYPSRGKFEKGKISK